MINEKKSGLQDTPHHDDAGTGTNLNVDHGPDHPAAQQGHDPGGRPGHSWMMMMMLCVPMLVIVFALVASGTAGLGTIVLAIGCTLMMAIMMGGMGGHNHTGGRK